MVNLNLTESELVFLQRLIGHSMTYGITNRSPLNLKDVSKGSWYSKQGDNRLILRLEE